MMTDVLLLIRFTLSVLLLTGVCASFTSAQTETNSSATKTVSANTISGRVTAEGKPVRDAIVTLWRQVFPEPTQTTTVATAKADDEGNYRLTRIPAGSFYIRATAPAYLTGSENKPLNRPRAINVDSGEELNGVNFELIRGGVITGRVTNAEGKPVVEYPVSLIFEPVVLDGAQPLYARTDDRGVYRVFGLPPGKYKVAAGPIHPVLESFQGRQSYPHAYYPGVISEAKAAAVEVSGSQEVSDIDIKLAAPMKVFSVTGRVIDGDTGAGVPHVTLGLEISSGMMRLSGLGTGVLTNERGEFKLDHLPAGQYSITAPERNPGFRIIGEKAEAVNVFGDSSRFDVVDADVSGIEIRTARAVSVSGVIVVEGLPDGDLLSRIPMMTLTALNTAKAPQLGMTRRGSINTDRSFIVSDLRPGRVRLSFSPPVGGGPLPIQYVRTEHDGAVIDDEFEIQPGQQLHGLRVIFAHATGGIRGSIKEAGNWRGQCSVVLKDSKSVMGFVSMDARGRFLIEPLSAGEYTLSCGASDEGKPPRQWRQPVVVANHKVSEVVFGPDK